MGRFIDISGRKFDRLKVLKRDGIDKWGLVTWFCACKCGKNVVVRGNSLKSGSTRSCGCFRRERTTNSHLKHGHACKGKYSNEYRAWRNMINRCYNSSSAYFVYYGGRGIKACDHWRGTDGFKNFYADMGKRPTSKHSLDRIENDKGYNKANCRWATKTVQSLNQRMKSNNTSGVTGIFYNKRCKKFESRISINGKSVRLGFFEKFEDAVSARRIAEEKYYKPILKQAKGVIQ